ncbi:hypothetical protein BXZ70DRAFT_910408 [Cristinia sonorae]|uniref:Uncharacterized protein n=1 Tax=Cristinia sonorae TaxID=1940300 RepID=A0A8K0XL30_9AGAR|nr:hypothetical protein BXZ70DRAFT_910408 [Cristinia sonorae]
MSQPARRVTRASNADKHPGAIVKGPPRRSSAEVATEKLAKENKQALSLSPPSVQLLRRYCKGFHRLDISETESFQVQARGLPVSTWTPISKCREKTKNLDHEDVEDEDKLADLDGEELTDNVDGQGKDLAIPGSLMPMQFSREQIAQAIQIAFGAIQTSSASGSSVAQQASHIAESLPEVVANVVNVINSKSLKRQAPGEPAPTDTEGRKEGRGQPDKQAKTYNPPFRIRGKTKCEREQKRLGNNPPPATIAPETTQPLFIVGPSLDASSQATPRSRLCSVWIPSGIPCCNPCKSIPSSAEYIAFVHRTRDPSKNASYSFLPYEEKNKRERSESNTNDSISVWANYKQHEGLKVHHIPEIIHITLTSSLQQSLATVATPSISKKIVAPEKLEGKTDITGTTVDGVIWKLAVKRATEWRSGLTSTAAAITKHMLDDLTPEERIAFAQQAGIEDKTKTFIYASYGEGSRQGAFRSPAMLGIYASHISVVTGSVRKSPAGVNPIGAVALTAAALKQAISFYLTDGNHPVKSSEAAEYKHDATKLFSQASWGHRPNSTLAPYAVNGSPNLSGGPPSIVISSPMSPSALKASNLDVFATELAADNEDDHLNGVKFIADDIEDD